MLGGWRNRVAIGVAMAVLVAGLAAVVVRSGGDPEERVEVADAPVDELDTTTTTGVTTTSTDADGAPTTTTSVEATSTTTTIRQLDDDLPLAPDVPDDEPTAPQLVHRGRVVDGAGNPVAGIYVHSWAGGMPVPGSPIQTDADGRYEIGCGERPLVIWGVGPDVFAQTRADQNWAPVFLGNLGTWTPPPCQQPDEEGPTTVIEPGVMITGLIFDEHGEPWRDADAGFTLTVSSTVSCGAGCERNGVNVSMRTTDSTGRYWLYGLPAGALTAHNMGTNPVPFEAPPGAVVAIDWGPTGDGGFGPVIPGTPPS